MQARKSVRGDSGPVKSKYENQGTWVSGRRGVIGIGKVRRSEAGTVAFEDDGSG